MICRSLRCTITLKNMLAEVINVQPLVVISDVNCYVLFRHEEWYLYHNYWEPTSSTVWTVLQNTSTGGASVLLRVSSSCFWVKMKWLPEADFVKKLYLREGVGAPQHTLVTAVPSAKRFSEKTLTLYHTKNDPDHCFPLLEASTAGCISE